jgi:hypothetical protein
MRLVANKSKPPPRALNFPITKDEKRRVPEEELDNKRKRERGRGRERRDASRQRLFFSSKFLSFRSPGDGADHILRWNTSKSCFCYLFGLRGRLHVNDFPYESEYNLVQIRCGDPLSQYDNNIECLSSLYTQFNGVDSLAEFAS